MVWAEIVTWLLAAAQVFGVGLLIGFRWGHKTGWDACDSFHKRWTDKE